VDTIASRFGHHLIIGLDGPRLTDEDKRLLSSLKPAGILLFARNFLVGVPYAEMVEEVRALIEEIKNYTERSKLFLTIDHEGGRVVRTPPPFTLFPYASLYGERGEEVAKAMAVELRSLGLNVSWAPVADIHSNPNNPVIGPRAFGTTAEDAASRAERFLLALQKNGVFGCAKHYPGHGDTATDSHYELPVVELDEEGLRQREIIPFARLSEQRVPFMMTAHVMFPNIDPKYPATLSEKILKGILREELRYEGIIVSDDLEMKAVSDSFGSSSTLAQAFKAGCDMFIIARNVTRPTDPVDVQLSNFETLLTQEKGLEDTVEKARQRIDNVLNDIPMHPVELLPREVFREHHELMLDLCY